jgi:hypothetical protein
VVREEMSSRPFGEFADNAGSRVEAYGTPARTHIVEATREPMCAVFCERRSPTSMRGEG